jgi:hypothetical protein
MHTPGAFRTRQKPYGTCAQLSAVPLQPPSPPCAPPSVFFAPDPPQPTDISVRTLASRAHPLDLDMRPAYQPCIEIALFCRLPGATAAPRNREAEPGYGRDGL